MAIYVSSVHSHLYLELSNSDDITRVMLESEQGLWIFAEINSCIELLPTLLQSSNTIKRDINDSPQHYHFFTKEKNWFHCTKRCTCLWLKQGYPWYLCGFSSQSANTQVPWGSLSELWQSGFHPENLVPTRRTKQFRGKQASLDLHLKDSTDSTHFHIIKQWPLSKNEKKKKHLWDVWYGLTKSRADPPPKYSIIIHNFVPWKVNQILSLDCVHGFSSYYNRLIDQIHFVHF